MLEEWKEFDSRDNNENMGRETKEKTRGMERNFKKMKGFGTRDAWIQIVNEVITHQEERRSRRKSC